MEQTAKERPAKFGLIGCVLSISSIVVILMQLSAFFERQEKSRGAFIGEIAADIEQSAARALAGKPAPKPAPAPRDHGDFITIAALCAAGVAVALGGIGLYRNEPNQLPFMAVGIGASALVMQYVFWLTMLIWGAAFSSASSEISTVFSTRRRNRQLKSGRHRSGLDASFFRQAVASLQRSESPLSAFSVEALDLPETLSADSLSMRRPAAGGDDEISAGSTGRFAPRVLDQGACPARPHDPGGGSVCGSGRTQAAPGAALQFLRAAVGRSRIDGPHAAGRLHHGHPVGTAALRRGPPQSRLPLVPPPRSD